MERWKHLSLQILDSRVQSSLNLWFSRETTTLRHQDADGIHHRPFKVQLWQCPILHPCGTWQARSGFYHRCFGIQNAVLLNVAWCWMCVCVCVCLTLGSIISSTYNHNTTILQVNHAVSNFIDMDCPQSTTPKASAQSPLHPLLRAPPWRRRPSAKWDSDRAKRAKLPTIRSKVSCEVCLDDMETLLLTSIIFPHKGFT